MTAINGNLRLTDAVRQRYLILVARTGQVCASAYAVGLNKATIYRHRDAEPEFDAAVSEAQERYRDWVDAEIRRRGIEGIEEPVFYQGRVVGWVRKFSDQLALAHAKAHDPRYREKLQVDATVNGGVMVVPASASPADWEKRFSDPAPS